MGKDLTAAFAEAWADSPHQMPSNAPRPPIRPLDLRAYDESKHPRDDRGRWTDAGGVHGIQGLPANVAVKDRLLGQAVERGAFEMTAVERDKDSSGRARYELTVAAKIPEGIESFIVRPDRYADRVSYYNPELADLHTANKGEQYLEFTFAKPKAGLSEEIAPLGDGIIYRGMRTEEYEKFLQTGEIVSTGKYNIGKEQEGLTYWATDPATAVSYASSFAPWPHKATFERPAYVVATKMPKETRKVDGTGENEVGVERAIMENEVVGVWRGDVFEHTPGYMNLRADGYALDETDYKVGASSSPSSRVIWQMVESAEISRAFDPNQPRDDRGRWTDTDGNDALDEPPASAIGYKPGLKAASNVSHDKIKREWIADSPIKSLSDLLERGPPAQSELVASGERIAKQYGVTYKNPGVKTKSPKGIARTSEKMKSRGAAGVTDVVRSAFVVEHPAQVEQIASDLGKTFEVTLEDWKVTPQGYMDRSALIRFKNGMIGEIQFMDAAMSNAKSDTGGNGHGMYVEWRSLDPSSPRAVELVARMRKLYGDVTAAYATDWKAAFGKAGT